jgi:hypothetical protein
LYKLFKATIDTFSRFALIMHGFHSGGVFTKDVQRPPFTVLIKHLGTTLTNGIVGEKVLTASAGLVSTTVAMTSWIWLDAAAEGHYFSERPQGDALMAIPLVIFVLVWYMHKWVLLGIVLLTLLRDRFAFLTIRSVACQVAGIFMGCVCMLVLQFFVDIVFHSTDGLIYSYVLQAEAGQPVDKGDLKELHDLIQEVKVLSSEAEPVKPDEELELPTVSQKSLAEPLNTSFDIDAYNVTTGQVTAAQEPPPGSFALDRPIAQPVQQQMTDEVPV